MSTWSGYKFTGVHKDDQHRFYRALRDAKIPAYEFPDDDLVFAMTAYADEATLGDIVPIVEILHRSIPWLQTSVGSKCTFLGIRLEDDQMEMIEHAVASERKVDLDQVHARIRSEEGEGGILRQNQQKQ